MCAFKCFFEVSFFLFTPLLFSFLLFHMLLFTSLCTNKVALNLCMYNDNKDIFDFDKYIQHEYLQTSTALGHECDKGYAFDEYDESDE